MELTNQTPESVAAAAAVLTPQNAPTPAENVRAWWKKARRVYPEATLRAWRFDWAAFLAFCKPRGLLPLPASPSTVAAFIEACGEAGKKPATVRRYLATIACAHRAAKILNPNDDEDVKMALKGLYNRSPKRQRQAKALGWHEIKRFLITAGDNIRADRERALIAVAYDTMARRSELVAMDVEDFSFMEDWSRAGDHPAIEDRPGGGGESRVFVAGYGGVSAGVAQGVGDQFRGGVSAVDRTRADRAAA